MNEELQKALTAIINKTLAGIDAGTAFLQAELPDVIQQLLLWKLAEALILVATGLVVLAISAWVARVNFRKVKVNPNGGAHGNIKPTLVYNEDGDIHPGIVAYGVVQVFVAVCALAWLSYTLTAVQIFIAPKIYLIEYAASLAK